jgi:hypothetical protein
VFFYWSRHALQQRNGYPTSRHSQSHRHLSKQRPIRRAKPVTHGFNENYQERGVEFGKNALLVAVRESSEFDDSDDVVGVLDEACAQQLNQRNGIPRQ